MEAGTYVVSELDRMHRIPEAIICANDCMAAGAIMELQDRGYRVPEDVLVTGFDNVSIARIILQGLQRWIVIERLWDIVPVNIL